MHHQITVAEGQPGGQKPLAEGSHPRPFGKINTILPNGCGRLWPARRFPCGAGVTGAR